MTNLRTAAEKALHALEDPNRDKHVANTNDAINSLRQALAQLEPVVSFTDNEEGLCIQLACDGAYHWQNLSENEAAEFFVNAYRGRK